MKTTPRNVAILLLYNAGKQFLLQHRSESARRYPGCWGVFGGGIEGSETPEDAMGREIREELEYSPQAPVLFLTQAFENAYGEGPSTKYAFIERYDDSQALRQHEGQGLGWFTFEEIKELPIIDHDLPVYEAAEQYIQNTA